jgi:hypothetical protein
MATKKKVAKKGGSSVRAWEIGGAVTAATLAAAAGAYILSDKKTKAKAKKWVSDTRKKAVGHAKTVKKLGKKEYAYVVKELEKRYGPLDKLTAADVIKAGKDLKGEWDKIQGQAKTLRKKYAPKKTVKKKKAAKKSRA